MNERHLISAGAGKSRNPVNANRSEIWNGDHYDATRIGNKHERAGRRDGFGGASANRKGRGLFQLFQVIFRAGHAPKG
jgi:hypothetical protein